jgi:hypothetical protein
MPRSQVTNGDLHLVRPQFGGPAHCGDNAEASEESDNLRLM